MTKTHWRCFHCNEVFHSRRAARAHFGSGDYEESEPAACVDPLRKDEEARLRRVREAEAHALKVMRELETAEDKLATAETDLRLIYRKMGEGCTNAWQVRDRIDNLRFELEQARGGERGPVSQEVIEHGEQD